MSSHTGKYMAIKSASTRASSSGKKPFTKASATKHLAGLSKEIRKQRKALAQVRKSRARLGMPTAASTQKSVSAMNLMRGVAKDTKVATPTYKLMAQGDSWFNYWIGKVVLYWLNEDFGHTIDSIAVAGSTLNDIVYGPVPHDFLDFRQTDAPSRLAELVDRITTDKPDALLLSGGGNDIAGDEFFNFVNNKLSNLDGVNSGVVAAVISPTFIKAYEDLINAALAAGVAAGKPLKIFTHAYDYPWPDGRGVTWMHGFIGPWFDNTFTAKNYPKATLADLQSRHDIVAPFIDALNEMLVKVSAKYPGKVFHIKTPGTLSATTGNYRNAWANELHPTDDGFRQIAKVFQQAILNNM